MSSRSPGGIARENGAKSKGPVSSDGKQRSSQNATKHGFYSRSVVLNSESPEAYKALQHRFVQLFQPENSLEHEVILDIVNARWRIRRIEGFETSILNIQHTDLRDEINEDYDHATPADEQALCFHHHAIKYPSLDTIRRFEVHYHRLFDKSLKRIAEIRKASGRPVIEFHSGTIESDIPYNNDETGEPRPPITRKPVPAEPQPPPPPPAPPPPFQPPSAPYDQRNEPAPPPRFWVPLLVLAILSLFFAPVAKARQPHRQPHIPPAGNPWQNSLVILDPPSSLFHLSVLSEPNRAATARECSGQLCRNGRLEQFVRLKACLGGEVSCERVPDLRVCNKLWPVGDRHHG